MRALMTTLALLTATATTAQAPADFPAGAQPLAAGALKERLTGKVFRVAVANGNVWRLQFQGSGTYFINIAPNNYSDDGRWRTEGSALCTEPKRSKASCNEMRLVGEALHMKRDSGEIVKLEPQ